MNVALREAEAVGRLRGLSWGGAIFGGLVAALVHPSSWAVALAGFIGRRRLEVRDLRLLLIVRCRGALEVALEFDDAHVEFRSLANRGITFTRERLTLTASGPPAQHQDAGDGDQHSSGEQRVPRTIGRARRLARDERERYLSRRIRW